MKLCALSSGSSGNSFYVESDDSAILIDAGLSSKQLIERMRAMKINPSSINGIFITHEHCDHIRGADVLARSLNIPIFATKKTISNSSLSFSKAILHPIKNDETIKMNGLAIETFSKSHSASDPVSFLVHNKKKSAGIITDLGHICKNVSDAVSKSDFLFLESNYDQKMLEKGPYLPWHKNWVLSDEGHLSNMQSSLCILEHAKQNLSGVILSHLSKVNNTPELAKKTFKNILRERTNFNPAIEVSLRESPTQIFKI